MTGGDRTAAGPGGVRGRAVAWMALPCLLPLFCCSPRAGPPAPCLQDVPALGALLGNIHADISVALASQADGCSGWCWQHQIVTWPRADRLLYPVVGNI